MAILGGKMKMTMAMKKKYNNAMAKCRRTHPHLSLMQRKKMAMAMCNKRGGYALGCARKRVGRPRKHHKRGGYALGGARKRVGRPRKHHKRGGSILGGARKTKKQYPLILDAEQEKKYKNELARLRRAEPFLSLAQRKSKALNVAKHDQYAEHTIMRQEGMARRMRLPIEETKGYLHHPMVGRGGYALGGYALGGYALGGARKKSTRKMTKSRASKKNIIELIDLLGL